MKFLTTILSSLAVGLALAAAGFSPLSEVRYLLHNKHKIFASALLAITGYVIALTAILVALVQGALQLDARGFIEWSAVYGLALGLLFLGIVALFAAREVNPVTNMKVDLDRDVVAQLDTQFNLAQLLQQWMDKRRDHGLTTELREHEKFSGVVEPTVGGFKEIRREDYRH